MDAITATQLIPVLARLMDGMFEGVGSQAWESLTHLVKRRQRKAPELEAAVQAVNERPDDQAVLSVLATTLESYSRVDAEFGRELQEWYTKASKTISGQTANIISGTVKGPAVQARDIHGGITFGKDK